MATTKTVKTYALNGSSKDFTIPFEYLARKFVTVTLIGATRTELILNSGFRFTSPTQITTTQAWGPAQNYDLIEIRRFTSATERLVDFADGSILRAYDLNTAQVQSLHIAEEARDLTADTIGVNNDGHLDARARRIVNVADAVNPGDAVNLRMQQQWAGSALNQAIAAAQSAAQALSYRDSAWGSSVNSANSGIASENSRQASQAARLASEEARDTSLGHATWASKWASAAEDVIVQSGLYSAYHYMRKALGFANAASASATASATSASQSAGSASFATTEANRSTTQADRAKTEADKLANMNQLGGALDAVTGVSVRWKGSTSSRNYHSWAAATGDESHLFFCDQIGNIRVRVSATAAGDLNIIDDAAGKLRLSIAKSGKVAVGGAFQAVGYTTLDGGATFGGATEHNGVANFNSTVAVKGGLAQIFSANDAGNAHVWFYGVDGTSRGIIYAGKDGSIRFQGGGPVGLVIDAAGSASMNALRAGGLITAVAGLRSEGGIENYGRVASYRQGISASAGMYAGGHYMAQTDDGTPPSYGFHRGGSYGLALWLNGQQLNLMDSGGVNREVLTNVNLLGWLAAASTSDVIGTYMTCQNVSGSNLGQNALVGGGSLRMSTHNNPSGAAPTGSWRNMGWSNNGGVSIWHKYA
ncbi:tail fiber protein [Pseudomonas phage vB_PpuP-Kallioja]